MRNNLILALSASLVLGGCGGWSDSQVNPRNWFGPGQSDPVPTTYQADALNPLIPQRSALNRRPEATDASVAIAAVTRLRVERTTTGAIIQATGIASRQGVFATELRLDPTGDENPADVLSLTFRVVYPEGPTAVGTEHTRTIHEAHSVSNQDLSGIRLIRVRGAQNVMEARHR